jgi:arylsulfatase A-like enzyme
MNPPEPASTGPRRAALIMLRGLGAQFLGPYGNEWIRTPTFDRLAARGVVADNHFATSTDPAAAQSGWTAGAPDLVVRLSAAGVATIRVGTRDCQDAGWVETEFAADPDTPSGSLLPLRTKAYELLERLPSTAPCFLFIEADVCRAPWKLPRRWLDYYFVRDDNDEPLTPWTGPLPPAIGPDDDGDFERIQSTFGAVVSYLDRQLAKLLAGLKRRGFGQRSLIVVTSDLGMPLGEIGPVGQTGAICESCIHIPLLMRRPRNADAGSRISELTTPPDVAGVVEEFFGIIPASPISKLSGRGTDGSRDHVIVRGAGETAVITRDYLLLRSESATRLFARPADPWQAHDIANERESDVAQLEELLSQEANRNPDRPEDADASGAPSAPPPGRS